MLADVTVLADVEAVVGIEDDHGVVPQSEIPDALDEMPEPRIHERNRTGVEGAGVP